MGLALNDAMRERLRQVRKSQLLNLRDWPGAESILLGLEVVCVRLGFGNASFVGIDGKFLFLDYGNGHPLEELTEPEDLACAAAWATEIGLPELLEALPPMPHGGHVCRSCRGRRWGRRAAGSGREGPRPVCRLCSGLGWTSE